MYWFMLYFYLISAVVCNESRLVNLFQGPVRGYKDLNNDIFVFYNIPYATVPSGKERFKAPLPPPVWSEPFEAVDRNVICPQTDYIKIIPKDVNIQENCLLVNIYVPVTNKAKLPVVVYVHGGAYSVGFGNVLRPKNLLKSKEIIVVTFNYRVGAHGFLCLGTKDVPGNAGMKDQVTLLRWVNKNIANFGGDPDEVTLAGYSAGSSSVDLLMLSKMTKGLFKRVIPESGANTAPFSIQFDPIRYAKEYAKMLNFDNVDDFYALENFFKTIPYEILTFPNVVEREDSTFLMVPCVERDLGEEIFLEDNPVNILKSGNFEKLPMLYGFTNMEGLFRMPLFKVWKDRMNEKFSDFLPADLEFKNEDEKELVANHIKTFYFGNKLIGNETMLEYIDYFSDVIYKFPTLRSVKLQLEAGNDQIYLYEYSYVGDDTALVPYNNVRGANHCDQSFTIFDGFGVHSHTDDYITADFKEMKTTLRKIWLNFMTRGKPILPDSELPAWHPVVKDWSPHMSINKFLKLRGSLKTKSTLFWEGIYDKYYRYPVPPVPPPN